MKVIIIAYVYIIFKNFLFCLELGIQV